MCGNVARSGRARAAKKRTAAMRGGFGHNSSESLGAIAGGNI